MAAKPKLSPEQWAAVRERWEGNQRDGYAWLVEELSLPVSAPAVRKVSIKDGWKKRESRPETKTKSAQKTAKSSSRIKPQQANPAIERKVSKVSQENHHKVSETIDQETFDEEVEDSEESARRPVGRPTIYRDEYVDQARRLALLGLTNDEMAKFFGIGTATFDRWMAAHDVFRCAVNESKFIADGDVAQSLYKRAVGYSHPDVHISNFQGEITVTDTVKHYPPDTGAGVFWLKNRQPRLWRDKVEIKEEINLNVFPPREVLEAVFNDSLRRSGERAATLANRRERLGIVIEHGEGD